MAVRKQKIKMKKTYEQALKRLEEITEMMEAPATEIEKLSNLYKEATELALFCSEKLTKVEGEVSVLKKEADNIFKKVKFFEE